MWRQGAQGKNGKQKKFKESSRKPKQLRFIHDFTDTFLDSSKDGELGKVLTSPSSELVTEAEFYENIYSSIIFRISYFCFFGIQTINIVKNSRF